MDLRRGGEMVIQIGIQLLKIVQYLTIYWFRELVHHQDVDMCHLLICWLCRMYEGENE